MREILPGIRAIAAVKFVRRCDTDIIAAWPRAPKPKSVLFSDEDSEEESS